MRTRWARAREFLQRLEGPVGSPAAVGVWLIALSLLLWILANRARTFEYVGIARALQYEISPSVPGTVVKMSVDLYNPVERGQIVARLDDADVRARLATERAMIEQLAAQVGAETARVGFREADVVTDRRRFQVDEQRLQIEMLSIKVALGSDRIELERLNLQVERSERLGAEGILAQSETDNLRLERDALARRIEENGRLLEEVERQYRAAAARRETYELRFPIPERDPLLEPLRAAVRAQELRIEEIEIQRRGLVLRSPVAGRVSQVLARGGQYVIAGEPVALVEEEMVSEIVAYASELTVPRIAEGSSIRVMRRGDPSVVAESIVTRVGAAIEVTPQRLWRDPGTPEYALPFVIAAAPHLKLRPGELVDIAISEK